MPSIIEVDTIKNKTGTQNTVLSTDGSGNNTITGTLGSATVFPAGMVRNVVATSVFAAQDFDGSDNVVIQLEIPNVLASSKIYISYKIAIRLQTGTTASEGFEARIYRGGTSQSAGDDVDGSRISPDGGNNNSLTFAYKGSVNIEYYGEAVGFMLDESPDTGTNRYKLTGFASHGTPQRTHDGHTQFSLMEVTG